MIEQDIKKNLSSLNREVGDRIRHFRKLKGLNQTELAASLDITFQQLQKYENGVNRISFASAIRLAQALKVDLVDLCPPTGNVARDFIPTAQDPAEVLVIKAMRNMKPSQRTAFADIAQAILGGAVVR